MNTMSDSVRNLINSLAESGDRYAEQGEFSEAYEQYCTAWDLIPEPKTDWDAALWLLVALGDTSFSLQEYRTGSQQLLEALCYEEGEVNPFVHLRLGQCLYELGKKEEARKAFRQAYEIAGESIFQGEKPKYLESIQVSA